MSPLGGIALAIAITAVATLALGACGGNGDVAPTAPPTAQPSIHPDSMLGQASDRAKAILARGVVNGGLTRDDLDEAAQNAMECLEALGVTPQLAPPMTEGDGYSVAWGYHLADGADPAQTELRDSLANDCVDREYYPIEGVYTEQPVSVELQEAREQRWREEGLACLDDAGIPVDGDAPWDEVLTALVEDFLERHDDSCHTKLGIGEVEG